MFVIVVGGSQGFIEECRKAVKNVTVKIVGEASSVEDVGLLIRKSSPHAALIHGEWAQNAAGMAKEFRNTKIFVSGGIEKSKRDEWDESGLPVFVVSAKSYKALLDLEAHLKFTSPTAFNFDEQVGKTFLSLPGDIVVLGTIPGARCFSTIKEVIESEPTAVLLPVSEGVVEEINAFRREFSLSAVPIIVIGKCDEPACFSAGADECIEVLDKKTLSRIYAKASQKRSLWDKVVRDALTGLYGRKFLNDYLQEQERRYLEAGVQFSLLICDLDHFKRVNDTYGHQAGDEVLKEFASFLKSSVRGIDIIARFGGEEFVVVFPGDDFKPVAEKLCRNWSSKKINLPQGKAIQSTFSAGLAVMGRDARNKEGLIKAADDALYQAKNTGRNRVAVAGTPLIAQNSRAVLPARRGMPFSGLAKKMIGKAPAFVVGISDKTAPDTSVFTLSLYGQHSEVNSIRYNVSDFKDGEVPKELMEAIKKGYIYLLFSEDIKQKEIVRLSSQISRVARWYFSTPESMVVTAGGELTPLIL